MLLDIFVLYVFPVVIFIFLHTWFGLEWILSMGRSMVTWPPKANARLISLCCCRAVYTVSIFVEMWGLWSACTLNLGLPSIEEVWTLFELPSCVMMTLTQRFPTFSSSRWLRKGNDSSWWEKNKLTTALLRRPFLYKYAAHIPDI